MCGEHRPPSQKCCGRSSPTRRCTCSAAPGPSPTESSGRTPLPRPWPAEFCRSPGGLRGVPGECVERPGGTGKPPACTTPHPPNSKMPERLRSPAANSSGCLRGISTWRERKHHRTTISRGRRQAPQTASQAVPCQESPSLRREAHQCRPTSPSAPWASWKVPPSPRQRPSGAAARHTGVRASAARVRRREWGSRRLVEARYLVGEQALKANRNVVPALRAAHH